MKLWKINEGGSAFLIVNNIEETLTRAQLAALAAEKCAVYGAQGLLCAEKAAGDADCRAVAFAPDGSERTLYGDGARGLCRWAYENGVSGDLQRIETPSGELAGARLSEGRYRVRMGAPGKTRVRRLLQLDGRTMACAYLELGSPARPFAVMRYGDMIAASDAELTAMGASLSRHEAFPGGADVFLYDMLDDGGLIGRTYSRSAEALTPAGTAGAAAAAALLALIGAVSWKGISVEMPGDTLVMDVDLFRDAGGGVKCIWGAGDVSPLIAVE